jgi:site-specific recombinase XerD
MSRRGANNEYVLLLLNHAKKGLARITLSDLQTFAESLSAAGLAPVSRVRVLAAAKSLFGFCYRMRHIPRKPRRRTGATAL